MNISMDRSLILTSLLNRISQVFNEEKISAPLNKICSRMGYEKKGKQKIKEINLYVFDLGALDN
jgi:hypothetical protein